MRDPRSDGSDLSVLLERDDALEAVAGTVRRARDGDTGVLLVTGAAGVGKTTLLSAAEREAADAGLTVLTATGGAMEQDRPFAVVAQLLRGASPELSRVAASALSGRLEDEAGGDPYAVLDALYWAVLAVAERGPLALVVDDAHWADAESLRWLSFVVRRAAGLPVAILVATRPSGLERPLLAELAGHPRVRRLELQPLTVAGTAALLRGAGPGEVPDTLLERYHELTGGNPFYVRVLAWALAEDQVSGTVPRALVDLSAPLPEALRDGVLSRLRALGPDAVAVARAVAVLGADASQELVAEVAGLSPGDADAALRSVADAGIVAPGAPVTFRHPLVSDAVYADLGADAPRLHRQAARVLEGRAAEIDRIAGHLVRTTPSDELWVVETLAAAARAAVRRGAPDTAVRCLRRALAEPLARGSADLVLALGTAELLLGDPGSSAHLEEAVALAGDGPLLEQAVLAYARACTFAGRVPEAVSALQAARGRLAVRDPEAALRLDVETAVDGVLDLCTLDAADAALARCAAAPEAHEDAQALAVLAMQPVRCGTSAAEAAALARRSLALGRPPHEAPGALFGALALLLADEVDEARRHLTEALEDAQRCGSVSGAAQATLWRAHAALRAGDVVGAGADATAALTAVDAAGVHVLRPYGVAFLTDALVERGELDEAEELWTELGLDAELPLVLPASYLLFSRGSLHLARGRTQAAVRDLLESGRRQRAWRYEPVAWWPYASRAALAVAALGEHDRAADLADEEVAAARRYGAARALGTALRARALLARAAERLERLEEAVEVLARSPDRLEHARARVDLGATLLRTGRRTGVAELEAALAAAGDCGATALVRRAQAELAAVGVRSSADQRGVDALTLSERRVAELAAEGRTNREIAQALYVTPKTVETHMARVLRKLRVTSRRELADVGGLLRG